MCFIDTPEPEPKTPPRKRPSFISAAGHAAKSSSSKRKGLRALTVDLGASPGTSGLAI